MNRETITIQIHHDMNNANPIMLVKVVLDDVILSNSSFEKVNWVTEQVALKVFEKVYPEIEKKILGDKQFKNLIMSKVALSIADKLENKKKEKESKKK